MARVCHASLQGSTDNLAGDVMELAKYGLGDIALSVMVLARCLTRLVPYVRTQKLQSLQTTT